MRHCDESHSIPRIHMSNAQLAAASEQLDLMAWCDQRDPRAFGSTFELPRDGARLKAQCVDMFRLMRDGQEWTWPKFAEAGLSGLQASHSARLRELRDFLEEKQIGTIYDIPPVGNRGLWRYVLVRCAPPYPDRSQKGRFGAKKPQDVGDQWPQRGTHYDLANK